MAVKRIIAIMEAPDPAARAAFYERLLDMEPYGDMGWIRIMSGAGEQAPLVSFASEGGSGAPTPAFAIEVDDLDATLARAGEMGLTPEYGPVSEPWGVRRFYVRDPAGVLINILAREPKPAAPHETAKEA